MDLNLANRKAYDTISTEWEKKRSYYWKPVQDFLKSSITKNDLKIIDLGCGTGRHLQLAQESGFLKDNIFGLDFSENQLKIARDKGFKTIKSDLSNIEGFDNYFDFGICIASFHHLTDSDIQKKALKNFLKIFKPNAQILMSVWIPKEDFIENQLQKGKFEYTSDKNIMKVYFNFKDIKIERFYYFFKEKELINLIENTGFKVNDTLHFEGNFYINFIKK